MKLKSNRLTNSIRHKIKNIPKSNALKFNYSCEFKPNDLKNLSFSQFI